MYDQSLDRLIDAVIEDGVITDLERKVVYRKAASLGIDQDEIEVYLEGRLLKAQKDATPKSGKHGVLKTCPNCGAPVVAGMAKCPDCGFAYTGIEAVSSAKELDRRLREVKEKDYKGDDERINIIRSFPIPNAREDLIDFLSALEPKALKATIDGYEAPFIKAYREKFMECLNKMKISFPDDPATKMFQDRVDARNSKRKKVWISVIVIIVLIVGSITFFVSKSNREEAEKLELLTAEYENWKASAMPEIEAYAEELDAKLDEIPIPTASNWEKCGAMWNKVSWKKSWKAERKYKEAKLCSWTDCDNGIDESAFKAFVEKKNKIGQQINKAHQQALMNKGMNSYEAHNHTANEFYESPYRR
ncbi:MAG: zinc ribbon domain-containing protein [Muribaculum sp.]|nr:zinc ribbon domain-containing protein [Muribaculum sp.]